MSLYTSPGVYIEELPSGQHTITGVATSIAAFIGWTNQGPAGKAVMVQSWPEYQTTFGGLIPNVYLGYAVYQFFLNGGSQAYIVRLCGPSAQAALSTINNLAISAANPGNWGNNIAVSITNVSSVANTFNLQVFVLNANGTLTLVESYTNLSILQNSSQYAVTIVNNQSNYITLTGTPTAYYSIAGSVASGSSFAAGDSVTQSGTGATGTVAGSGSVPASGPMLITGLAGGLPNATAPWTSGSNTFTPSAAPVQSMALTLPSGTAYYSIAGSVPSGSSFTAGNTITQSGTGATATVVGSVPASGPMLIMGLAGGPPNATAAWTSGSNTFTPNYSIAGSVPSGSSFAAGDSVTQSGTGATATVAGSGSVPASGPMLITGLAGGLPNATAAWTSGSNTFTPSAAPISLSAPAPSLALIPGTVTTAVGFSPGEMVTQTLPSGATATAYLIGASSSPSVTGIVTSGFLLVAGLAGAAPPNSFSTWVGGTSKASFTPSSAPTPTAAIPLLLGASPAIGVTDTPPSQSSDMTKLVVPASGPAGYQPLANVSPMFNLLNVPGYVDGETIGALQEFCATYRAFLIVDSPQTQNVSATTVNGMSNSGGPVDGSNLSLTNGQYTSNAAFYFPWVTAGDPMTGQPASFPPGGFVAGVFAATDAGRGVWKAPAGVGAGLTGSIGLQYVMSDQENGLLNPIAVNCLRQFPSFGNVVWGARTMAGADTVGSQWKYVPIRRLALFLESSLYAGTQWAVFEPNAESLWGQVRLSIGTFMQGLFLQGAFAGTTPQKAYFVKCDDENNTDATTALGILNVTVGFAPLYPAEFVVIQIQQMMQS